MSLWKSTDLATSAPKTKPFSGIGAITVNAGVTESPNGQVLFANNTPNTFHSNVGLTVSGVTAAEKASLPGPQHAGWVSKKEGTGPVLSITLTHVGSGYLGGNGFVTFAGGGVGSGANATYTINEANSNSIGSITVISGGANYNAATLTANIVATFTTAGQFAVVKGGRAGRVQYETLAALGSIV
jgi:hypothetical protein